MIGYLRGRPAEIGTETAIIDVQGVGYELLCSQQTLFDMEDQELVQLRVYTHVREDALQLYGFYSSSEKELFLSLIKVNGIGPKMAMGILSAAAQDILISLIEQGDVKGLSKLPKIGKKKAEQIVLSLKGKLVFADTPAAGAVKFLARDEIASALVHLGFKQVDVDKVVSEMSTGIELQEGVRIGLKQLGAQI